ncbi:hypothetical protein GDO81_020203 [Engystomops pustulosus]|uniref:Uncharacterized protein n=1 Tax=Engystomops pustulosus TaxID=76066 RepID=A0AAV6ZEY1_ENGPU|nr:hypothetical protein GDO81_020203 [Engystomops pustulosus]
MYELITSQQLYKDYEPCQQVTLRSKLPEGDVTWINILTHCHRNLHTIYNPIIYIWHRSTLQHLYKNSKPFQFITLLEHFNSKLPEGEVTRISIL